MSAIGAAPGIIVGVGVGAAASAALSPAVEVPKQEAWARNPNRVLPVDILARLVAKGGLTLAAASEDAKRDGYSQDKLAALAWLEQTTPAAAEAMDLWRRDLIPDELFAFVLRKAGLDARFVQPIIDSKETRPLDPAVAALAIVRGLVDDQGILPVAPPTGSGKVSRFPTFNVDAVKEAAAAGYDRERLSVMVGNMGRPASPQEALAAWWRGAIDQVDYWRAIAEGDVRNEWRDAIEAASRAIPSPNEAAELWLRGWIPRDEALALAGMHGMEHDHTQLLYELHGRPLNVHAVVTGLARGGQYPGSYENVPQPFRDAIRESSIREEWVELDYANRFSMPSAFVVRALAQAGELSPADAEDIFRKLGWPPDLAKKVAAGLAKTGGGAGKAETQAMLADEYEGGYITEAEYRTGLGDLGYAGHALDLLVHLGDARRIKRYREKVVDAIAAAFVAFRLSDITATSELAAAGVTGNAASQLIALWKLQRLDTIRTLTPAQVKKAHKDGLLTDAAAMQALEWLHYTPTDATTYLAE